MRGPTAHVSFEAQRERQVVSKEQCRCTGAKFSSLHGTADSNSQTFERVALSAVPASAVSIGSQLAAADAAAPVQILERRATLPNRRTRPWRPRRPTKLRETNKSKGRSSSGDA
jgi:hypothetical protein